MRSPCAIRARVSNVRTATASPAPFVVLIVRQADPDVAPVVLRGEFVGTLPAAKRHALHVLQAATERHGRDIGVQVLDAGLPIFTANAAEVLS